MPLRTIGQAKCAQLLPKPLDGLNAVPSALEIPSHQFVRHAKIVAVKSSVCRVKANPKTGSLRPTWSVYKTLLYLSATGLAIFHIQHHNPRSRPLTPHLPTASPICPLRLEVGACYKQSQSKETGTPKNWPPASVTSHHCIGCLNLTPKTSRVKLRCPRSGCGTAANWLLLGRCQGILLYGQMHKSSLWPILLHRFLILVWPANVCVPNELTMPGAVPPCPNTTLTHSYPTVFCLCSASGTGKRQSHA